jgi:hypothetical protein
MVPDPSVFFTNHRSPASLHSLGFESSGLHVPPKKERVGPAACDDKENTNVINERTIEVKFIKLFFSNKSVNYNIFYHYQYKSFLK